MDVDLGGRPVLQRVDIGLESGEVLGLLGPNGAGKTTLLRVLASVLRPARGRVLVYGQTANMLRGSELAKIVAYLPQGASCYWDMAVEDVVALGRLPHRRAWVSTEKDDRRQVYSAMDLADVLQFKGRPIYSLSGGERARVLLARALAGNPRILLADEPISGLDPAHQLDVMALLRRLASEGAAVVVILHDLILASRFCDRIVLLHQGRVAAQGLPSAALSADNLAKYYTVRSDTVPTAHGMVVIPVERIRDSCKLE